MLLWGAWELELFLEALLVQLALVTPSEREMVRSWHLGGHSHSRARVQHSQALCSSSEAEGKSLFPQPQVS